MRITMARATPLSFLFPLLLLGLVLVLPSTNAGCVPYTGQLCVGVIDYDVSVSLPIPIVEALVEAQGFGNLTTTGALIDPVCAKTGLIYACSLVFPKCVYSLDQNNQTVTTVETMCKGTCDAFVQECSDILSALGSKDKIPDCTTQPEANCFTLPVPPTDMNAFECPGILIKNPNPDEASSTCVGDCCIPCPPGQYFYKEGKYRAIETLIFVVTITSLILVIFTAITYLLMEEKRSFPSNIVTCICMGIFFFYFSLLFDLGDPSRVRCINEVTLSEPGNNKNPLCQTQALFVIYGILASVLWYFLLAANIYVSVIFMSKRMRDFRHYFHLLWLLPLIPTIIAGTSGRTGFVFGVWCITELGRYTRDVIMIPLAIFIFGSIPLNIHVLFKIAMVARNRNASLPTILRLQLRFFAFVLAILLIFLFYWIHFEVRLSDMTFDPTQKWVQDWFLCIVSGEGQNACTRYANGNVPNLPLFTIAEVLVSSIGIVIFLFFMVKSEVYIFWKSFITGKVRTIFDPFASTNLPSSTNLASSNGQGGKGQKSNFSQAEKEMDAV